MTGVDGETDASHEVQNAEFHGSRSGQVVPARFQSIPPFHRFSGWFAAGVFVFSITQVSHL